MADPKQSGSRRTAARLAVVVGAALAMPAAAQQGIDAVRDRLVGVYALIAYEPHGDEPTGRIWYSADGQMSAMLFPPGREALPNDASADEYRAQMRGIVAYFGTYTIDIEAGTVTHHIQGASNPAWIGDDFVRWFRFEDDKLRLSLGSSFQNTLLWQRLPANSAPTVPR